MDPSNNEFLALIMAALRENPNAEIIPIIRSLINNGQYNLQTSVENPTTEVNPIMEPSLINDSLMNENHDLRNRNSALRQELDDLFRAAYNEHNGQYNLQAALENSTTDIIPMMESPMIGEFMMNQNNDYMENNSANWQEMDELTMISAVYNEYNGYVIAVYGN